MRSFVSRIAEQSAKKRVDLDLTAYTRAEIQYLLSWSMGTKMVNPNDKPSLSTTQLAELQCNRKMGMEILAHLSSMESAVITSVSPISWDEKKSKVAEFVTVQQTEVENTVTKEKLKVETETIKIDTQTVIMPRINGVPQTICLEKMTCFSVLPFSAQAVNVAIAAGNLSERSPKGEVTPAVGFLGMKRLKIPYLSEAGIRTFCMTLENMASDMKTLANGVHGLEWMNMVYNHLVAMPPDDCFYACTTLLRCLYVGKVPFVRHLNEFEMSRVTKVDPKAKPINFLTQHSVAALKACIVPTKMSYLSTYVGCVDSRDFRKTDGKGMSGANQGAYTGEMITKATRNLRGKLTMVQSLKLPKNMELFIFSEDTDFLRYCPNFLPKDTKWAAVSKTKMIIPGVKVVNMVPTLQNCAALVFVEDVIPNLGPKQGIKELVAEQKTNCHRIIQLFLSLEPALFIFPCKVLDLDWNPRWDLKAKTDIGDQYRVRNCVGPSPHNLEYYKCLYNLTYKDDRGISQELSSKFALTLELTPETYMAGCNVANSFRNTFFLHRVPLEKIFRDSHIVHVPLVNLGKIPPLKEMTEQELQESLAVGGDAISNDDLLNFFLSSAKSEEKFKLDREDEKVEQLSDDDIYDDFDYPSGATRHDVDAYGNVSFYDDDDVLVQVIDKNGNEIDPNMPLKPQTKKKRQIARSDDESEEDEKERQRLRTERLRKKRAVQEQVIEDVVDQTDSDAGASYAFPVIKG